MEAQNPLLDVEPETLDRLGGEGLTRILRELVWLELHRHGITHGNSRVPLNINTPDGGIDASVEWEGGPDLAQMEGFPSRYTVFQSKATTMGGEACKNELLDGDGELKTRVKEALEQGASYVLFNSDELNDSQESDRIEAMRDAVRDSDAEIGPESVDFHVFDASRIVAWARHYPSVVALIRGMTGQPMVNAFKSWEEWAQNRRFAAPLALPEEMKVNLKRLRASLLEEGTVVRIVGLSGLGKTRLALEALRPPGDAEDNPERAALSGLTLYARQGDLPRHEIIQTVTDLVRRELEAVIVLDDCEIELHDDLAAIVDRPGSKVRLLTLDYELTEGENRGERLELTPESQRPVVRKMLEEAPEANELDEADRDRVEQFAQGFPLIAELLLKGWAEEGVRGDTLSDETLVTRMLFGREEDAERRSMIQCCALFAYFGVKGDVADQLTFIARVVADVDRSTLHRECKKFVDRGIMQRRGRVMRVRPLPLALHLAAEWWQTAPSGEAQRLIAGVEKVGLVKPVCRQLERLHEVENAREIAGDLCADGNPFTRAEVLRTSTGGRIFRALAVLNPPAAASALEIAFGDKTTEELLKVKDGRRQIVRALEQLAFHEETFRTAARMLLHFAAAENERWANNATGRFQQLFHIALSGTQTPAIERVTVLEEGIRSDDPERRKMAIKGLGSALKSRHFSRSVGEERKGRGRGAGPEDWTPNRSEEVFEYWRECLELLANKGTEEGEEGELAREKLGEQIGSLLTILGVSHEAEQAVRDVANYVDGVWLKGLEAAGQALGTRPDEMPEGLKNRLQQLREDILSEDLRERLKYVVTSPPRSERMRKTEEGEFVRVGENRARDLARELIDNGPPDWKEVAEVLCEGRQQHARVFGREVAALIDDPGPVVKASLEVLSDLPEDKGRHWGLIAGVLSNTSSEFRNQILDSVLNSEGLREGYWRLLQSTGIETEDLGKLVEAVKEGLIQERELAELRFSFGRVQPERLAEFANRILEVDDHHGPAILEIIQAYEHRHEDQWEELQDIQREVALVNLSASALKQRDWQRSYTWRETLAPLLRNREDEELARAVAEQIIELAESASPSTSIGPELDEVVEALFDNYLEEVWPMFGDALLSGSLKSMTIMEIVAKNPLVSSSETGPGGSLFRSIDNDFLVEWCEDNAPEAPALLGQAVPIFAKESESTSDKRSGVEDEPRDPEWHPFALRLLDEFGDLDEVRSSISSNIFSFSSMGSRIPYYERRIALLEELLEHDLLDVRQWASEEISRYEKAIEQERQEEQERNLRWGS
ncbi:hypothetical protein [Salinibacter ruber]|uniref:hypothetical protein n=1 Tax=Salinibacter ruber TaxID=146919 RepID=UPI002166EDC6|nr:hypothetical protein [Salinibacter ruber]MCS4174582.1 hypothetical protein [Salinibacter ruber]